MRIYYVIKFANGSFACVIQEKQEIFESGPPIETYKP